MKTTVVNIRSGEPYDVYIGRAVPRKGLKASPWGNPFKEGMRAEEAIRLLIRVGGTESHATALHRILTREDAVECYRHWLLAQPELVERSRRELKGKRLGCWCKPLECHGDVLVQIVEGGER